MIDGDQSLRVNSTKTRLEWVYEKGPDSNQIIGVFDILEQRLGEELETQDTENTNMMESVLKTMSCSVA